MTPAQRRRRLILLMRKHGLTRERVAQLVGAPSRKVVDAWLAPAGTTTHRNLPGYRLELLEHKLTTEVSHEGS